MGNDQDKGDRNAYRVRRKRRLGVWLPRRFSTSFASGQILCNVLTLILDHRSLGKPLIDILWMHAPSRLEITWLCSEADLTFVKAASSRSGLLWSPPLKISPNATLYLAMNPLSVLNS